MMMMMIGMMMVMMMMIVLMMMMMNLRVIINVIGPTQCYFLRQPPSLRHVCLIKEEIWFTALQKYESRALKNMHCLIIGEIGFTALHE